MSSGTMSAGFGHAKIVEATLVRRISEDLCFTDIDRKKLTHTKSAGDPENLHNGHIHLHHHQHRLAMMAMEEGDPSKLSNGTGSDRTKLVQSIWRGPQVDPKGGLKLYNSLTRRKDPFVPQNGNTVLWYTCGPTVYDASHMGHARAYISFDIIRRVLADYFNYDVVYAMNITDIDDKIIKRARVGHLIETYQAAKHSKEKVLEDVGKALADYEEKVNKETCPLKRAALQNILANSKTVFEGLGKSASGEIPAGLFEVCSEPIGNYLDKEFGHTITDNAIFASFPRKWEDDFNQDMEALHVLPADILTRVSEYVPEIIEFIKKIIENGFAYHAEGSVYFDTMRFDQSDKHHYAKLVPEAFGDLEALEEGEGVLTDQSHGKRQAMDFALWKASKPGEPAWDSKDWGRGRPGWHIECSVMATAVLGDKLDIHAGGVDLRFPHHDNEIAQSEAYFECDSWVNFFLHSGHLKITGCKMSKSLKNFITIKEALQTNSARQIRLAFLLHSWKDTLDYSPNVMESALTFEKRLEEFFLNVKDRLRTTGGGHPKWTEADLELRSKFSALVQEVHDALCDSIDTKTAMVKIRDLIGATNNYMKEQVHPVLLQHIGRYITRMMRVFGVNESDLSIGFSDGTTGGGGEKSVEPYVVLAEFREKVRQLARELKAANILQLCDELRDDTLPKLGVRLEDREGQPPAVKLVDKQVLMKERELKIEVERQKQLEKDRKKQEAEEARIAKENLLKINPRELFKLHKDHKDKYSNFDEKGFPTHDTDGKELSKGLLKKLQKLYDTHEVKYNEYHVSLGKNAVNGDA